MKILLPYLLLALAAAEVPPASHPWLDDYRAGRLSAAEGLLGHGVTASPPDLNECRLALYANFLGRARTCLRARPDDKAAQSLLAETEMRAGHFAEAARAFEAAGKKAQADRLRSFGPAGPYVVEDRSGGTVLPMERVDPLPLVRIRVNDGPPLLFVVDTGAGETVIDRSVAASAHASLFGQQTGVFGGGTNAPFVEGAVKSLRLGGARIANVPVMVLDTSSFGETFGGLDIKGVVGVGLLSRFRATLNYPAARLELAPPHSRITPAPSVRFWMAGDHYMLAEGTMNGAKELAFIDTGLSGLGCTAPESTLRSLAITPGEARPAGVNGAGIHMSAAPFTAAISLGQVTQKHVACVAGPFPPQLETLGGTRVGMLVSHTFFRPYAVTFDFDRMRISFQHPPQRIR